MSGHNVTGANCTPLGKFSNIPPKTSLLKPSYIDEKSPNPDRFKREFEHDTTSNDSQTSSSSGDRKRKRKSRWVGSDNEKVIIPGMPTMLPTNLTPEQERIYLLQLQIEEISRRLRTGDLGIPTNPEERSPSPEPIYNNEGKRLNTREFRTRKKLEDERHALITNMTSLNPNFKPPADYKPPQTKISEKVLIPQEEYPDINFVGLLIGPRGNTLKGMEKDTGAKIIIRGKGSVKEGKIGRKDGQPMPGEDEPLHAFITAPTHEAVLKAVAKIKDVIRQGIEVPESQNDLRRMQLRELALLNGTLRESDGPRCSNCGSTGHRGWQCPDKPNITNSVICIVCGGVGHIGRDCKEKKSGSGLGEAKIDQEYMSLMAELGESGKCTGGLASLTTTTNHPSVGTSSGTSGGSQQIASSTSSNTGVTTGSSGNNQVGIGPVTGITAIGATPVGLSGIGPVASMSGVSPVAVHLPINSGVGQVTGVHMNVSSAVGQVPTAAVGSIPGSHSASGQGVHLPNKREKEWSYGYGNGYGDYSSYGGNWMQGWNGTSTIAPPPPPVPPPSNGSWLAYMGNSSSLLIPPPPPPPPPPSS